LRILLHSIHPSSAEVLLELDGIQQLVKGRRELCQILSKEIGFLIATTQGYMAEIVRLGHLERQVLQELESLLQAADINLLYHS